MKTKNLIAVLALSTCLLTGCGFQEKDAIVVVNNDKVTQEEFNNAFNLMTNNTVIDLKNPLHEAIKDRIINELVVRKLLEQEIQKRNITISAEEEQEALKKIIDRYGSKEALQAALKQGGVSNDKFKKDLQNELKMRKLINMLGTVNVTDIEVKAFYKQNPDKFETPEKVRASHILISANPKEVEKYIKSTNQGISEDDIHKKVQEEMTSRKAKAEKILAEVKKNPKSFEKLARENSEDVASGQKGGDLGGDLGFFAYEDMVEPFSKASFSLKPNKVSDLVQTDYGYHIIMVKDRAKAGKISFEKSKDDIKQYLMTEKQVKLLENLIVNLKNNAKIEFIKEEYKPSAVTQEMNKK